MKLKYQKRAATLSTRMSNPKSTVNILLIPNIIVLTLAHFRNHGRAGLNWQGCRASGREIGGVCEGGGTWGEAVLSATGHFGRRRQFSFLHWNKLDCWSDLGNTKWWTVEQPGHWPATNWSVEILWWGSVGCRRPLSHLGARFPTAGLRPRQGGGGRRGGGKAMEKSRRLQVMWLKYITLCKTRWRVTLIYFQKVGERRMESRKASFQKSWRRIKSFAR